MLVPLIFKTRLLPNVPSGLRALVWDASRPDGQPRGVPAQDQEQLITRKCLLQLADRVRRKGFPTAPNLDVAHLEPLLVPEGEPGHLQALRRIGLRRPAMGRRGARDEQHAVETRALHRDARRGDVTHVNRVERAAQDSDPHGWYSNSAAAIRTVSPGLTGSRVISAFHAVSAAQGSVAACSNVR